MRVKISYGVEFDEIPDLIIELVEKARAQLVDEALLNISNSVKKLRKTDLPGAYQDTDKARQKLASSDLLLKDVGELLAAYAQTLEGLANPNPDETPESPSIDELAEVLLDEDEPTEEKVMS
tara:strand:- start:254 stop:619 length:366 start_codon:yes stop_codon:yes gene_type:complete